MAADDRNTKSGFNALAVVCCAVAGVVFVYALSLFLQGGYLAAQALETKRQTETPLNGPLLALQGEHQARLDEAPRWLDEQKTRAVMPIDAAMERLAAAASVEVLPGAPTAESPAAAAQDVPAGGHVTSH